MIEVLLVTSPGVALEAYEPLVRELRAEGAAVTPVGFPCSGDAASLRGAVSRAAGDRRVVVVAHGVGATLALQAAGELDVERWVLLGPVLDVVPGPGLQIVAGLPLGDRVDLTDVGGALSIWLGPGADEAVGCVSPTLGREVQGWIRDSHVPVDPASLTGRVSVVLGQLDEVATLEATLPAARRFPDADVVRVGIGRLDPQDYRHLELVREPAPVRVAVRAALGGS